MLLGARHGLRLQASSAFVCLLAGQVSRQQIVTAGGLLWPESLAFIGQGQKLMSGLMRRMAGLQVCQRLQELTGSSGLGRSLTSTDVAAALNVPLAIAMEHLLASESHGTLCRDDGPEGLRFYRNFFADTMSAAAQQC